MSKYTRQFPRSLPATYVRLKESRLKPAFEREIVPSYQNAFNHLQDAKRIWLYWAQGWEAAPELVTTCSSSWKNLNPDWQVVMLDDDNLAEYISLDGVPTDINKTKQSNVWRLRILEKYGGLWADATVLCMKPATDWLPYFIAPTGSFFFKSPSPDRPFASWLMAALPNSYIIRKLRATYEPYLRKYGDFHVFALHYIFDYLLKTDRRFASEFNRIPSISANPSLAFGRWISNSEKFPFPNATGVPVHKLSWKLPISMQTLDEFLSGQTQPVPSCKSST